MKGINTGFLYATFIGLVLTVSPAWATSSNSSEEVIFSGTVISKDNGEPVAYAWVRATLNPQQKTVSRMTDKKGRYKLKLESGSYRVAVERFGYKSTTRIVQTHNGEKRALNFVLEEGFTPDQLTSEQWVTWIANKHPEGSQQDADLFQQACSGCHNVRQVARSRGMNASEWESTLLTMTDNSMMPLLNDALMAKMKTLLVKYFGPDSREPKMSEIPFPTPAPEALHATYIEHDIPLPLIRAHTALVDENDRVWVTGYDWDSNSIAMFDIATEKFQFWEMPVEKSSPHTFAFDKQGRIWSPESWSDQLAVIDPTTGELKEYKVPNVDEGEFVYPHSSAISSNGHVWVTCMMAEQIAEFNPKTEKFNLYPIPADHKPSGSGYTIDILKGYSSLHTEGPILSSKSALVYGIGVDSKDNIWFTEYNGGRVVMLDPESGKFTSYKSGDPGFTPRGMLVSSDDNLWFANFTQKRIGFIDTKTGKLQQFKVPSKQGTPYAIGEDPQGNMWYSDFDASLMGKFDPKTQKFVEYRLPTLESTPRFFGFDSNGSLWFSGFMTQQLGQIVFD